MSRIVLIVAAHTDDEVLGCGGTIARHVDEGHTVHTLFMTDGVGARGQSDKRAVRERRNVAEEARSILAISSATYRDWPDNRMDTVALLDVVQSIEVVISELQPQVIYTHHPGDLNIDHRITHQAVMTACRPIPNTTVREIYGFEVLSSTEWATPQRDPFLPNAYVNISAFLETKLEALRAYNTEMREHPHSRSIKHIECLARHRGYSVGVPAAEAFMLIRNVR
jgi:N-acetylglucosamine malate deacetylase 1